MIESILFEMLKQGICSDLTQIVEFLKLHIEFDMISTGVLRGHFYITKIVLLIRTLNTLSI